MKIYIYCGTLPQYMGIQLYIHYTDMYSCHWVLAGGGVAAGTAVLSVHCTAVCIHSSVPCSGSGSASSAPVLDQRDRLECDRYYRSYCILGNKKNTDV